MTGINPACSQTSQSVDRPALSFCHKTLCPQALCPQTHRNRAHKNRAHRNRAHRDKTLGASRGRFGGGWLAQGALGLLVAVCLAGFVLAESRPRTQDLTDLEKELIQEQAALNHQIHGLVASLGASDYFARAQAEEALKKLGFEAIDALNAARDNPDLEIAKRAAYLLSRLTVQWVEESDPPDVKAQMRQYAELIQDHKDEQRREIIRGLITEVPNSEGLEALCRIVRFDPSLVVSKSAASAAIGAPLGGGKEAAQRRQRMLAALGRSLRPGAVWVRAHLRALEDPNKLLPTLQTLIRREEQLFRDSPTSFRGEEIRTDEYIVMDLLVYEQELLKHLNKTDEALQILIRLAEVEGAGSPTLDRLLCELIDRKKWDLLDQITTKFENEINTRAQLLYLVAEARLKANQPQEAAQWAARAQKLNPNDRTAHFRQAYRLAKRGMHAWSFAEREILRDLGFTSELQLFVPDDEPAVQDYLDDYAGRSVQNRQERIGLLSGLPNNEGLDALVRLVRYEESDFLARTAAAHLLAERVVDDFFWRQRASVITSVLGPRRPGVQPAEEPQGVQWLRAYLQSRENLQQAIKQFAGFLQQEEARLNRDSQQTSADVVAALLQFQFSLLQRAGQSEMAKEVLWRLIALQEDSQRLSLRDTCDLLFQARQWKHLDHLAEKYESSFSADPLLMYLHAEAKGQTGQHEQAQQLATAALGANPLGRFDHWQVALELVRRGLFAFAEKEYQYLIDLGPPAHAYTLNAKFRLAELLHQRQKHRRAARLLEDALATVQQDPQSLNQFVGEDPSWLPARVHFFWAEYHRAEGELQAQIERLLRAAEINPYDADVLITLFKLPEATSTLRKDVLELLNNAMDHYRGRIRLEPDQSTPYNQLAWLVANTTGDLDEALQCSQKSLKLRPGTAGYLDTLARCHFARGELKDALRVQKMAVQLDPYSPSLIQQLTIFEQARTITQEAQRAIEQNQPMSPQPSPSNSSTAQ